jgi:hypothetical protein
VKQKETASAESTIHFPHHLVSFLFIREPIRNLRRDCGTKQRLAGETKIESRPGGPALY